MDGGVHVHDIVEKNTRVPKPFDNDEFNTPSTGFPAPKKRTRMSAFKQQQLAKSAFGTSAAPSTTARPADPNPASPLDRESEERRNIDRENRERMAQMSPEEIVEAQRELMNGLPPSLLQRLLQRATIDDESSGPSPFDIDSAEERLPPQQPPPPPAIKVEDTSKTVVEPKEARKREPTKKPTAEPIDEDKPPTKPPADLFPLSDLASDTTPSRPRTQPDDLDLFDPNFMESLREKYFPDLRADPATMAWMAPIPTEDSATDRESPYYPNQESIPASALRFDFRGSLIPPRSSRSIPSTKGLHHHGLAPEAAGYTISELSILARSAVPAQRCIAFQTLGRILFRLGKGDWGDNRDDSLASAIWANIGEGRVLDSLTEAAMTEKGHRSSIAFATEAIWLFEKGGWKKKLSGR